MSKLYDFTITACEWGDTPEEAWEVCKENFDIDRVELPEYDISDSDDEEMDGNK